MTNQAENPLLIHFIDPLKFKRYRRYVEQRGCSLERTGETYLLHLPETVTRTTSGPFEGYAATRIDFSDTGYLWWYQQLQPPWNVLDIPETAFLADA